MAEKKNETFQYLAFVLDAETYSIEVSKVKEVLEYTKLTKVPGMPPYMRGVINLRGSVVPVIDLRLKFGLHMADTTKDTSIIVLEIRMEENTHTVGALVDAVKEVIELKDSDVEPSPRIGTRLKTDFISGMGKQDSGFNIILNIDRIFSTEEMALIAEKEEVPVA